MTYEEVKKEFQIIVLNEEVDPDDEYDWSSIAFGFFLAKGFHPSTAQESANRMLNELHEETR